MGKCLSSIFWVLSTHFGHFGHTLWHFIKVNIRFSSFTLAGDPLPSIQMSPRLILSILFVTSSLLLCDVVEIQSIIACYHMKYILTTNLNSIWCGNVQLHFALLSFRLASLYRAIRTMWISSELTVIVVNCEDFNQTELFSTI